MKKDWFGREKSADELHHNYNLWISEIKFIKDEIRFLEHLLGENYIDFLSAGLHKKIEENVKQISVKKNIGITLLELINSHEKTLSELIKYNNVSSNQNYLESYKKIEIEVNSYINKYKALKQGIFKVVEEVMKKKDQKKISGTDEIPKLLDK